MQRGFRKKLIKKLAEKTGGAIAEFAIVIPVAVIFLTAGNEAWQAIRLYDELEALSMTAARFASLQDPPRSNVEERTRNYIEHEILPTTSLGNLPHSDFDVKVERLKGTEWDSWPYDTVSPGDTLRVKIILKINKGGTFKSFLLNFDEVTIAKSYTHLNDRLVGVPPEVT